MVPGAPLTDTARAHISQLLPSESTTHQQNDEKLRHVDIQIAPNLTTQEWDKIRRLGITPRELRWHQEYTWTVAPMEENIEPVDGYTKKQIKRLVRDQTWIKAYHNKYGTGHYRQRSIRQQRHKLAAQALHLHNNNQPAHQGKRWHPRQHRHNKLNTRNNLRLQHHQLRLHTRQTRLI